MAFPSSQNVSLELSAEDVSRLNKSRDSTKAMGRDKILVGVPNKLESKPYRENFSKTMIRKIFEL